MGAFKMVNSPVSSCKLVLNGTEVSKNTTSLDTLVLFSPSVEGTLRARGATSEEEQ